MIGKLRTGCSFVAAAALGAILALASSTAAQDAEQFGRTGFYVGALAAYSFENFDTDATGVDVRNARGFDLRVGYRAHPNLAIEGSAQHYRDRELEPPGGPSVDLLSWGFWMNVKVYALTGRVQPYALIGPGVMHLDAGRSGLMGISRDDNGFAPRGGLGFDIYATENIAATLEASYVFTTFDIEDKDHIPVVLGVTYRF